MMDWHANPDWYRVKYCLAAEYTNWALALEGEGAGDLLNEANTALAELRKAIAETLEQLSREGEGGGQVKPSELQAFLLDQIQPSAELLGAGIQLARVRWELLGPAAAENAVANAHAVASRLKDSAPHDADVEYNLACFYAQTGQVEDSREHLRAAVGRTNPTARRFLFARIGADPALEAVRREGLRLWLPLEDRDSVRDRADAPPRQRSWV